MAEPRRSIPGERSGVALQVSDLNLYYGASHALQGVNLTLDHGVLSVVGRNGMGKTSLCKAIMGLEPVASGSIRFHGRNLVGLPPAEIARLGLAYVPQGRRLWRSLSVDEHLRMVATHEGPWTIDRIYSTFPRLAERRGNGGGQLSGGEQQMLAISRALLMNPRLLVMDEPTEGLAPVIVAQVADIMHRLGEEGDIDVLVIEQNIGVATAVSEQVAIMVNGRVNRIMPAEALAADRNLQQSLLGVGRGGHHDTDEPEAGATPADAVAAPSAIVHRIYQSNPMLPTRWSRPVPVSRLVAAARTVSDASPVADPRVDLRPLSSLGEAVVLIAGTLDTKGDELRFLRDLLKAAGVSVRLVDLSTRGRQSSADIPPHQVAAWHPRGAAGVFVTDRGEAVAGMALAFERWVRRQTGIAGILGAGGSGATAMVTPAMRALPIGIPKLMVSTVASGEVGRYVGPSDIMMMHSVADVQGLNRITRDVLGNAAQAMIGMARARREQQLAGSAGRRRGESAAPELPSVGLTMFGVTTPAIQRITRTLAGEFDCLVFHATGVGGRAMENLVDTGQLLGVIDLTTTEITDFLVGGDLAATDDRLEAFVRSAMPYVGAPGALDMVNFGPPDSVPAAFREQRQLLAHNPQVTLMRTTAQDNERIGRWIGAKLNRMRGPVRFLLPEGGVSALDAPGQPFHAPALTEILFAAIESQVTRSSERQLIRLPMHINDPAFADEVVRAFRAVHGLRRPRDHGNPQDDRPRKLR